MKLFKLEKAVKKFIGIGFNYHTLNNKGKTYEIKDILDKKKDDFAMLEQMLQYSAQS